MPDIGERIMNLPAKYEGAGTPEGKYAYVQGYKDARYAAAAIAHEALTDKDAEIARLRAIIAATPGALDLANSSLGQHLMKRNSELRAENQRLREVCKALLHDLVTSEGLWACDNEQGQSLFQLQHPSIQQLQAAIGGKEPPQ